MITDAWGRGRPVTFEGTLGHHLRCLASACLDDAAVPEASATTLQIMHSKPGLNWLETVDRSNVYIAGPAKPV